MINIPFFPLYLVVTIMLDSVRKFKEKITSWTEMSNLKPITQLHIDHSTSRWKRRESEMKQNQGKSANVA